MNDQPPQGPDVKLGDRWHHLVAVARSSGGYVHWAEAAASWWDDPRPCAWWGHMRPHPAAEVVR